MKLSHKAQQLYDRIGTPPVRLGDLKKIAREIRKDHAAAMELWSTGEYYPRLLATLIMDKGLITQELIDSLTDDLQVHSFDERNHIMEWLMANQLTKSKKTLALIESWENSPSPLQRRTFWYHQARLRWTGQPSPENTPVLLSAIEEKIAGEAPEVQWAMNFTAAWIGVYDESYRQRCIKIGETTGLYKDEVVPRGCTPGYLPAFIETEVGKRVGK